MSEAILTQAKHIGAIDQLRRVAGLYLVLLRQLKGARSAVAIANAATAEAGAPEATIAWPFPEALPTDLADESALALLRDLATAGYLPTAPGQTVVQPAIPEPASETITG